MQNPTTDVAFVGATLIDGTGAPPRSDAAVVVSGDRISWVGQVSDLSSQRVMRRVEVTGKYLIPGLMDANAHLVFHCDPEVLLKYDPGRYDELVIEAAQIALRAGVTTVFDTWGPLEALRRVRDKINTAEVVGSRIFLAGNIIGNGGPWSADFWASYGDLLNPSVVAQVNQHWEQGVGGDLTWMSAKNVRSAVREYIATSGIDFVKYASSAHGPRKQFLAFSPEAQRAIVEEAHAAGMTARACTLTPEALKVALGAGIDMLPHGDVTGLHPMEPETLDLITERQIPCVMLLMTDRHVTALREKPAADPMGLLGGSWANFWLVTDHNDRQLIKAGANILLATDGGLLGPSARTSTVWGPYTAMPDFPRQLGSAHLLWLKAAVEHGMTPMDALLAATRNVAEGYHCADELGTIESGKRADLVLLDANPLDDPANYGRIAMVVKDGEMVDTERLPENPILTAGAAQEA